MNILERISCLATFKPTMLTFLDTVVTFVENLAKHGWHFKSTELEITKIDFYIDHKHFIIYIKILCTDMRAYTNYLLKVSIQN